MKNPLVWVIQRAAGLSSPLGLVQHSGFSQAGQD